MKFENSQKKHGFTAPRSVTADSIKEQFVKAGYDVPTLITGYGSFYYCCDRAPTASEPDCYTDIVDFLEMWWDQTHGNFYLCSDNTTDAMVWNQLTTNLNITDQLAALGITIPASKNRSNRASPAFGGSYQPSITNAVEVNAAINLNALLAFSSEIDFAVSADNFTWDTVAILKKALSLGANETYTMTFTVPTGYYYKANLVSGTTSNTSIVFFKELLK
jgi:plastocyanin